MEHEYLIKTEHPPRVSDAMIAMRVPSFVVFLASAWFFVTPLAYYGVSLDASAANCWCVGGILLLSCTARLWFPIPTAGLSWFNMILGLWVLISPWIFGFTSETGRFVNTLCLGTVIVGMSLASVFAGKFPGTPLATAYEDRQGLEEQEYEMKPPRRRHRY
ncbi:MAG TPA: SPW repeat protein [Bryobacteraceae bacterium]|nr:SPW repeat protein [Bryobacteraceae bacterium]